METLLTKIHSIDNITRYYSNGDLADSYFLKNIIDNLKNIEENISLLNCNCSNLEDLYQYFWCCNFKKLLDDINRFNLNEDIISRLKHIGTKINLNPKYIIQYINENFIIVFDETKHRNDKWHAISYDLLEFCYKRQSKSIKPEVFRYIENNLYFDALVNFEICSDYYKKNKNHFENLFINLKSSNVFDDFIYTDFLEKTNNVKDEYLKEITSFICNRSLQKLKDMEIQDDELVYEAKEHFDRYYKLACKFKLPIANEYYTFSKTLDKELKEYVKKHGHEFNGEAIDLTKVINNLRNEKTPVKFLELTHYENNGVIKNVCHYENNNLDSLSEDFNEIDNPRSDKYPYWKQNYMTITSTFYSKLLSIFIDDNQLSIDLYNYLLNICNLIEEKYFNTALNLAGEVVGNYEIIINVNRLYKEESTGYLLKALENSCACSLCGIIEKILRNVLLVENFDASYIDIDCITLASILDELSKNDCMSKDILNYLEYFLTRENNQGLEKNKRPGKNIRNIQMHDHDDKYMKTDYGTVLHLLFMLILLLNEILIKIKQN